MDQQTIRAFNQQERLIVKNDSNNDGFGRAMLAQNVCFRWLSIRLNSMSTGLTSLVTSWICLHPDQLDPGLTAMVITYSLQVTGYLQWLINTFTQLEIEMNSIERVKHYSEIDTEAAYYSGDEAQLIEAPSDWPRNGSISFDRICARYRPELPLVLENVTFEVKSNEKVGVVGRTGSGKSTLMNLLFRIVELDSGSISIDGVNIAQLGLSQLRKAISMLPQDPTLFTGSIREVRRSPLRPCCLCALPSDCGWRCPQNIDPFEQYTDAQVWDALEKAQMKEALEKLPEKLDTAVGEGGDAFSVGERQLLCLARSILAEAKLLIMVRLHSFHLSGLLEPRLTLGRLVRLVRRMSARPRSTCKRTPRSRRWCAWHSRIAPCSPSLIVSTRSSTTTRLSSSTTAS